MYRLKKKNMKLHHKLVDKVVDKVVVTHLLELVVVYHK